MDHLEKIYKLIKFLNYLESFNVRLPSMYITEEEHSQAEYYCLAWDNSSYHVSINWEEKESSTDYSYCAFYKNKLKKNDYDNWEFDEVYEIPKQVLDCLKNI